MVTSAVVAPPARTYKDSIAHAAYEEAGIGPDDLDLAEVYDLSTALELDWYENIGLCGEGEAEALLRSGATTIGGRIPVNASGGLACFGEAIPAQAIAQDADLAARLTSRALDEVLDEVPDEWFEPVPGAESPEALRARYVEYLRARVSGPRPWLPALTRGGGAG